MSSSDEEDAWLPLGASNVNEGTGQDVFSAGSLRSAVIVSSSENADALHDVEVIRPSTRNAPTGGNAAPSSTSTNMRAIQRRLETRQTLRANLIEQPLNQFFGKFLGHLARELWTQDYYLRCGLALLAIGLTMQTLSFALMGNDIVRGLFRYLILLLLGFGSYLYVYRPDETLLAIARFVSESKASETFYRVLEGLNPTQLRRLCFVALLLPTFLEMKAITFLACVIVESGWVVNGLVAVSSFAYLQHVRTTERLTPRECSLRGLIFLKLSALLVTVLFTRDLRRINALAGPFVIAAGSMLISNHPALAGDEFDWLSRAIRHALRLTLRDVLGDVGQNVGENEMLKIAMLRWAVDYWNRDEDANDGPSTEQQNETGTSGSSAQTSDASQEGQEVLVTSMPTTDEDANDGPAGASSTEEQNETGAEQKKHAVIESPSTNQHHPQIQPQPQPQPNHTVISVQSPNVDSDIGWDELWTMLSMTTDQMFGEVPAWSSQSGDDAGEVIRHDDQNSSVKNLKEMLESLDVDGRAKPAVQSYKVTIEEIPPSRNMAIALSIARRCPALLALLSWYCTGSYDSVCATLTLLPCIWMEIERLKLWSLSCHRATSADNSGVADSPEAWIPQEIEPMTILLSPDSYSPYRPTSSLQVWANMKASVGALEMGLTAVRAAHTTAAATELTFDVVNLAQFGVEVYKKGWLAGGAMIAKDVCHFLATDNGNDQATTRNISTSRLGHGRHTASALNAMKNSQVVARNVSVLMEEEGGKQVIENVAGAVTPAVDALTFVAGRGWLWGKRGEQKPTDRQEGATEGTTDVSSAATCTQDDAGEKTITDSEGEKANKRENDGEESKIDISGVAPLTDAGIVAPPDEPCVLPADGLVTVDTAAEAMQLMADALEKEKITKEEKDRFVETILTDKSTIDGIKRSLKCLIEESAAPPQLSNATGTTSPSGLAKDETDEELQPLEQKFEEQEDEDAQDVVFEGEAKDYSSQEEVTDSDDALASVPLEASGTTNDSWEPANDLASSTDDPNISAHSHATLPRANVGSIDSARSTSEKVRAVDFDGDGFDVDGGEVSDNHGFSEDEGSWTQIDADGVPTERQGDGTSQLGPFDNEQSHRSKTEGATCTTSQQREGGQGEDWMKWVGGGLAVAGAVLGSIALANHNNNNNDRGQGNGRNAAADMKSNVTIELLDSDDER